MIARPPHQDSEKKEKDEPLELEGSLGNISANSNTESHMPARSQATELFSESGVEGSTNYQSVNAVVRQTSTSPDDLNAEVEQVIETTPSPLVPVDKHLPESLLQTSPTEIIPDDIDNFVDQVLTPVPLEYSWGIRDDMMLIHFENDVHLDILTIHYKAHVELSEPNGFGWRELDLAGLSFSDANDVQGRLTFILDPAECSSKAQISHKKPKAQLDRPECSGNRFSDTFDVSIPYVLCVRLKAPLYDVLHGTSSITLCTEPEWTLEGGTRISHCCDVTRSVECPDIFAECVRLTFIVKHGIRRSRSVRLQAGKSEIFLEERFSTTSGFLRNETQLHVIRPVEDVEMPLKFFLSHLYPASIDTIISLPSFRPVSGTIKAEVVYLSKLGPPMYVEHLRYGLGSLWAPSKWSEHGDNLIEFRRVEASRSNPKDVQDDDIRVRFKELPALDFGVSKEQSNGLSPTAIIRSLKLRIEQKITGAVECQMRFDIERLDKHNLLSIDPQGWAPSHCFLNGRLATEDKGELRMSMEGNVVLSRDTTEGLDHDLKLELHWIMSETTAFGKQRSRSEREDSKREKEDSELKEQVSKREKHGFVGYKLPTILGRTVLSGCVACNIDGGKIEMSAICNF